MPDLPSQHDGYPPGCGPSDIGCDGLETNDLRCERCKADVSDPLYVCPYCHDAVCPGCWSIDDNKCKKCVGE